MKAKIIAIGDEILIGQTLDTNSNYIAKSLSQIGVEVLSIETIADKASAIRAALAHQNADILLFTGGLGPTKDDITKKTVSEYFNSPLVSNEKVLDNIGTLLQKMGRTELNELNRQQALIPAMAEPLMNKVGTAPGMWLENEGVVYVFMPGIPFEMKYLMQNEVLPRLESKLGDTQFFRKNVMVFQVPESELALLLENWENHLPSNMSVAYLPTAGLVKMRLTVQGGSKKEAENLLKKEIDALEKILGDKIISTEGEDLASIIGAILQDKNWSIATAESFTTGRIITQLCSVSGSSQYVKGSLVPYQLSSKEHILKVDPSLIEEHKVVSEEMALEMASKAQKMFASDIAVSTTGVAGPSTDEQHPEIGLAYVGIKIGDTNWTKKFYYPNLERDDFAQLVSRKALEFLFSKLRGSFNV